MEFSDFFFHSRGFLLKLRAMEELTPDNCFNPNQEDLMKTPRPSKRTPEEEEPIEQIESKEEEEEVTVNGHSLRYH